MVRSLPPMPRLSTHWRVSTSTRCHVAMDIPCSSHGTIRRVTKTSWRRYPFMTLIIREKQLLTVYKNFRSSCKFFMCFVSFFVASIMSWGEVGNTVCMPKQKCPKLKKKGGKTRCYSSVTQQSWKSYRAYFCQRLVAEPRAQYLFGLSIVIVVS